MDNDAEMLRRMGNHITDLQVKYRGLSLGDQMELHPALVHLLDQYAQYQKRLIMVGVITTAADLNEIQALKAAVDAAAKKAGILTAIAKLISFVAVRV
jgi:hypothetical protein